MALPVFLHGGEGFAIVTKKTNTNPITKAQLKRLLLGQGAAWPGGAKMNLVLGPPGEPSRLAALKQIAGLTDAEFNKQVLRLIFVGRGDVAPETLASIAVVRQTVGASAETVGIIPPGEVTAALNSVEIG
jgi:hypothetical protein